MTTVRQLMPELAVEPLHFAGDDEARLRRQVVSRLREFDITRRIARAEGASCSAPIRCERGGLPASIR